MGFRTYCTDKACRKEMEPVIDKKSMAVYCTECGSEVANISDFMKRQMVSMGQVRKAERAKHAYAVKCNSCGANDAPKLGKNKEILCSKCGEVLPVSGPFAEVLRQKMRSSELG